MNKFIFDLFDKDSMKKSLVGGKAINLCKLSNIPNIKIPKGFVLTTNVFDLICKDEVNNLVLELDSVEDKLFNKLSEDIRNTIEKMSIPSEIQSELEEALSSFSSNTLFAVRSSATAEYLSDASFAGQQDSYLNIEKQDLPLMIMKCLVLTGLIPPMTPAFYYIISKSHPKKITPGISTGRTCYRSPGFYVMADIPPKESMPWAACRYRAAMLKRALAPVWRKLPNLPGVNTGGLSPVRCLTAT